MTDSTGLYYKGKKKIVRLYDGLKNVGFPMPGADGPRWEINWFFNNMAEWEEKHGSADRPHTDLCVGGA